MKKITAFLLSLSLCAAGANRRITLESYRDKVYGAWLGQIAGASYGFNFEGKARNVVQLDHYLNKYEAALVDDDYYYEMVALYGFERFGPGMTIEQLGDMWKEYRAGTWGSSEQARLALERGIQPPETGSPRYNRLFHTIGPEFSSDIYGMISPGMVNLAGAIARKYSHINGYAEGSDGAVFVAACISEAFFETNPAKIVRQAAQLIDPRSNYRKAIDLVVARYEQGKPWLQVAAASETRWRPDYPQMNNSVANGALVALGLLYGDGDFLKSINVVTHAGDNTDADCNAANVASVIGAMHGFGAIPKQFVEPFHNRIYGDHMGPLKLGRTIDEHIDDLARRVADTGQKNLLAGGASLASGTLVIPRQAVQTQPLEYFDINDYGKLWNPDWRLENASRAATYLDGDVLVTFPRDTRPAMLTRSVTVPAGNPHLNLSVGNLPGHPWRLQVFADDDNLATQVIDVASKDAWKEVSLDLSPYAGRTITLRLYQWLMENRIPGTAYWRSIRIE